MLLRRTRKRGNLWWSAQPRQLSRWSPNRPGGIPSKSLKLYINIILAATWTAVIALTSKLDIMEFSIAKQSKWRENFFIILCLNCARQIPRFSTCLPLKSGSVCSIFFILVNGLTELSVTDENHVRVEAHQPSRPSIGIHERFVGNWYLAATQKIFVTGCVGSR